MTTAFVGRCSSCRQAFKVDQAERERGVVVCPSCGARHRVASGVAGGGAAAPAASPPSTTAAQLPPIQRTAAAPAAPGMTEALPGARTPGLTFSPGDSVAGRYRIERFLAQGGMGAVYAARDLELGGPVALKTLHAWIAGDPQSLERFKREIQLARRVTHPNVCRIFDFGVHAPDPGARPVTFYTMELVAGETLAEYLRREGAMRPEAARPWVEQMAAALAAAHAVGVIHRDFKSENVFLADAAGTSAGGVSGGTRVVVADFGIARAGLDGEAGAGEESVAARLTGTGQVLGTPAYMSPEQLEGGKLGPTSDVYSLGVVLYEMVTGRLPFQADTAISTAVKRLTEAAPSPRTFSPDLDPRWETVILRCLERHPVDRFQSPLDVLAALAPSLPPAKVTDLPSRRRSVEARSRRRKSVIAALLVAGLAVAAASAWWRIEARRRGLASAIAARPSIAVLGFRNLSGQPETAWLSTALAEMLSTELAGGGGLRVIHGDVVARAAGEGPAAGQVLPPEAARRLRASLGADYLVFGSYALAGPQLRLDLRLQDAVGGRLLDAYAPQGSQDGLFDIVRDAGRRLQERLGVEPAGAEGFWARRYHPEATRLYAEGVDRLRRFDAQGALDLLERAVEADPRNPVFRSALASAWSALGYSENALAEAKHALDLAADLPPDERLAVEGRYRESVRDWPAAAAAYTTLLSTHPDDVDVGLRLAAAQSASGQGPAAAATLERLRALPPPAGDDPRIQLAAAAVAGGQGSFGEQRDAAVRAAVAATERGLWLLAAEARISEGLAERQLGNPARAAEAAAEARRAFAEAGDRGGGAAAASVSAGARMDQGDLEAARRDYDEALQTYRALGDLGGVARTTNNLAVVLRNRGALAEARGFYEEALTACRTSGDRVGLATTLNNLAALRVLAGDLGSAEQALGEALQLRRAQGDRAGEASALANLGTALRLRGDLGAARRHLETALALRRELGQRIGEGLTLVGLGRVLLEQAELAAAAERFARALELCREAGGKPCEADALAGQGEVLLWQGDIDGARDRHRQALGMREATGDRLAAADSKAALARVELDAGDAAAASRLYAETIPALAAAGALDAAAAAQAQHARARSASGDAAGARVALAAATARAMVSQARSLLVHVALAEARLAVASNRRREAAKTVGSARDEAEKAGLDLLRLEAEATAVELGLEAGGVPANARRETLLHEAQARGVGWVQRRLTGTARPIPSEAAGAAPS